VTNVTANALLALGASPLMSASPEEQEELLSIASALVLNIGTLHQAQIEIMLQAGKAAKARKVPVVLDPVGAGASALRTGAAMELLEEVRPDIIRGNGSEILALSGSSGRSKGVDSLHSSIQALEGARELCRMRGCTVAISGPVDVITNGEREWQVMNGHPLMAKITGMGCTATALVGAFAAVNPDPLTAALHGMAVTALCGECAASRSNGPGGLQVNFLDQLHLLKQADLNERLKVEAILA
jgi:hydroxyethylthiazole kinase